MSFEVMRFVSFQLQIVSAKPTLSLATTLACTADPPWIREARADESCQEENTAENVALSAKPTDDAELNNAPMVEDSPPLAIHWLLLLWRWAAQPWIAIKLTQGFLGESFQEANWTKLSDSD